MNNYYSFIFIVDLYQMKYDTTFESNHIIIGNNAKENSLIVKNAKSTDLWFHLSKFPSCHVILNVDVNNPATKDMIIYCCKLVKENTKYKNLHNISVEYIEIKYVKLTNIPGLVNLLKTPKYIII